MFAYVPGPGTIAPGVRQLSPGHLLSWQRDGQRCRKRAWWTASDECVTPHERLDAVLAETERLFEESVARA